MLRISLPLLASVALFACSRPADPSKLDTTSDKLKEYGYVVKGTLEIPLNEEAYKAVHLIDTYSHAADIDKTGPEYVETMRILNDAAAFQQDFQKGLRHGWPLTAGNKIDGSKVKYWVARQLKFNENQLKSAKVSTTLKDIRKWSHAIHKERGVVEVEYEAFVLGVRQITFGGDLNASPLSKGDEMRVPLNPVSFYFDALGPKFKNLYNKSIANGPQGAMSDLVNQELIQSTKTSTNCLVSEDQSVITPFNSFYYYQAAKGCAEEKLTLLKVMSVEEIPVDVRFPEYHRLFSDKKVTFFGFYGIVDNEDRDAKRFAADLQREGYTLHPDDGTGIMNLSNTIGGVVFDVKLAVEKLAPTARSQFRQSIKDSEIVVYDGHAGYGASIDDAFSTPEGYPENTYQIFVLNGCNTYKYGTTQIMHTKSISDFDFHNMNVDVISTYEAVTGHSQQTIVLKKMEEAARQLASDNWSEEKKKNFAKSHSWLGIVTAINIDSNRGSERDNGIFMVSGEESNDYTPGKASYVAAPAVSEQQMLDLISDETLDEQYRMRVMDALTTLKLNGLTSAPLADQLGSLQGFCRDIKAKHVSDVVLSSSFHAQSCQIKKLKLQKTESYEGLSLQAESVPTFYSNGKLHRAITGESFQKDGIQFSQGNVSFHENGQIASGSTSSTLEKNGIPLTGGVTFFPDGSLRGGNLARDFTLGTITWRSYSPLIFSSKGEVLSGTLAKPAVIAGLNLPAETNYGLDEKGLLKYLQLPVNAKLALPEWDLILTGGQSNFREGKPVTLYSFNEGDSIHYKGEAMRLVYFYFDGSLAAIAPLALPESVPYPCKVGEDDMITYHRNGSFAFCTLESAVAVGGVSFRANDQLILDESGKPMPTGTRAETYIAALLSEPIGIMDALDSAGDIYTNYW